MAKITILFFAFFLVLSGHAREDGLDVRPDLRPGTEQEGPAANNPDVSVRSNSSREFRWRQTRTQSPLRARGIGVISRRLLSAGRIHELSFLRQHRNQDLYTLQEVYRL